jgi:hypothetical protein
MSQYIYNAPATALGAAYTNPRRDERTTASIRKSEITFRFSTVSL